MGISIVSKPHDEPSAAAAALAAACSVRGSRAQQPDQRPTSPKPSRSFGSAVQAVLSDTGVPGAGLALVRMSGVEWAGGVGLADRERKTPVTADTHFRAGSISKSFIASAIVQMYLDDEIDLDTPVSEIAPEIQIDNAWEPGDPGARHPPAATHRRLRRHALQRDVQRLGSRRPAARRRA